MPDAQVFISYNSNDAALAAPVVAALKARGIRVWIDHEQVLPGQPWLPAIEQAITGCTAVAVLLGPHGLGPVHAQEMAAALSLARNQAKPVIPVLLAGAGEPPPFLNQYSRVSIPADPAEPGFHQAIGALVAGITAAPQRRPAPPPTEHCLQVRQHNDSFEAAWDNGDPFPIALPLTKPDLDELAWYLERYIEFPGPGDRTRAAALEARLETWGRRLNEALFPGGAQHAVYQDIRSRLDRGERVLLTLASDSPAFLIRPWEMLRDGRGPLALRGLTVRRRLRTDQPPSAPVPLAPTLRLLLIVARPADTGFIDPRTSVRPVLDALDNLGSGPGPDGQAPADQQPIALDFCEPPTLPELERRLAAANAAGRPYRIVHFDGHGQYYPETGVGALCFEDAAGRTRLVPGRDLGDLLSRQRVPLVLLEACRGAQLSDRPIFGAVAPALLKSGVGSVIAFSHSVHVAAAQMVSERLYQTLVAGRSIGAALEEARHALRASPERWLSTGPDPATVPLQDWLIPQLYQAGPDPALVPPEQAAAPDAHRRPRAGLRLPGFPPPPRYRFHGRARELLRLERLLLRQAAVLVHAGGGMGKTALAREAAHWWRRTGRFDLALFHSFETQAGAEAVVQLIGARLGGDTFARLGPDDQWAAAVRLFQTHRVLLVWDNFESVLPVWSAGAGSAAPGSADLLPDLQRLYRELTDCDDPGHLGGRLLVTCRPTDTALDGIAELHLAGLSRPDALHLLRAACERRAIDLSRPGYARPDMDALLDRLEDHPLSIELIAPHLKDLTPAAICTDLAARLHQFQDPSHGEGRNQSLLASLDFSRARLTPRARAALAWLGWFQGGMFEAFFLHFAGLAEADWAAIRAELVATALLRIEDLPGFNTPYLKLHPTLADAAGPAPVPTTADDPRAGRFIDCYLGVRQMIDGALRGSQPAAGMTLTRLELANLRRALDLAFAVGRHRDGALLAQTLRDFLERAGRLRERDRLVEQVRARMPADRLDGAACAAILQHAWSLFTRGEAQAALDAVLDLERRLADADGSASIDQAAWADGELDFQRATTWLYRGRILLHAGRPDLALDPLTQAIDAYRALGEGQQANLSASLGDLANALSALGRTGQALAGADEGLAIDRALGRDREVATGLGRTAAILMDAGHHAEAEVRYGEALAAAERVGDLGLQGTFTQHLGILQRQTGRAATAVETLKQALRLFQQAGNRGGEMQTCDLLGTAEKDLNRLDPAEAWYRKALALAEVLGAQSQIGITRQNLGILFQLRALALPSDGGGSQGAERDRWLAAAIAEIATSLTIKQQMGNPLGAAASHYQLSVLHRLRAECVNENETPGCRI
ncbi:TIR domain-containing protein [uncultured Thiodictyon sp.]|uniref:TIR domain-containing protein n=1 Tax=uncultured Thiodictyon sp. TaxID=1846217 RepID=UPI0025FB7C04|nr:TIR domain-containing protein [uncultured Thiodictyon sp.]